LICFLLLFQHKLWDAEAGKQVRTLRGHSSRIGSLAWNNHILTTGSRDTTILNHDVRVQQHIVGSIHQHTQEVCGLAWSPDGSMLASGANDNCLKLFDVAGCLQQNANPVHNLTDHQVT
jgi:cell division cycle protein 20 (cofactor of APC complex)